MKEEKTASLSSVSADKNLKKSHPLKMQKIIFGIYFIIMVSLIIFFIFFLYYQEVRKLFNNDDLNINNYFNACSGNCLCRKNNPNQKICFQLNLPKKDLTITLPSIKKSFHIDFNVPPTIDKPIRYSIYGYQLLFYIHPNINDLVCIELSGNKNILCYNYITNDSFLDTVPSDTHIHLFS